MHFKSDQKDKSRSLGEKCLTEALEERGNTKMEYLAQK
jgi:hypothetical protein